MSARDQELVKKVLGGDRDAFGELVEHYSGLVHGVIFHKIRRGDEVEDLVQDVFCKAYEELPALRDPGKFGPWLGRIALNRAQAWLRQYKVQKDYRALGALETQDVLPRPDSLLENGEVQGIVWEALDRLRPEYRQILLLFHFEQCRQQDIARFLNISLPTVKWRLLRARQTLHRKLQDVLPATTGQVAGKRVRARVMAALPLVAFFRPTPRNWGVLEYLKLWEYRRLAPLAFALSFGVLGGAYWGETATEHRAVASQEDLTVYLHQVSWDSGGLALDQVDGRRRLFPPCAEAVIR